MAGGNIGLKEKLVGRFRSSVEEGMAWIRDSDVFSC